MNWKRNTLSFIPIGMKKRNMIKVKRIFLLAVFVLSFHLLGTAQQIAITGKVSDSKNEPLLGVNISVKGTAVGTVSDENGQFSLTVSDESSVLLFKYIGYIDIEQRVGSNRNLQITMKEDLKNLEEVVVVGYGTQKKVNLTGAVGTVNSTELNSRITPSTTALLEGRIPGLQVTQNSAMPGNEGIEMQIRGMGTYSGGTNPLILVDGVEGDLTKVNPNMIDNISILKDASSTAIYGSRAANGVILVTTKTGNEGRLNVEYTFNYSSQRPTEPMKRITNSVEYMELVNKAIDFSGNVNTGWRYTDEEIDRYRKGQDPNDPSYNPAQYPNCDWLDYLLRNGAIQQHFLNINGGRAGTTYNAGLGYMNQTGLLIGTAYQRYDAQFNFKSALTDRVTFGTNISMNYGIRHDTSFNDTDMGNMNASRDQIRAAYAASPLMTPQLPDGSGRWSAYAYESKGGNKNPIEQAMIGGGQLIDNNYILASSFLNVKIIDGLNAEVKGAVKYNESENKIMLAALTGSVFLPDNNGVYKDNPSTANQSFRQRNDRSKQYTLYGTLTYLKTLNKVHNIGAMAGYSQENYNYEQIEGYRIGYTTTDMWYLHAGPTPSQTNESSVTEWALMSFFGRLNYDYNGKYLFEANVRQDGTSRLPKSGRWGTFPSVSAGWRISEEDFMKNLSFLTNLKIRGSWGQSGNQMTLSNYPYQDVLNSDNYNLGGTMSKGYYSTAMINQQIKWETTTSTNVGIDFSILHNKLYGSVDWYRKYTTDILRLLQVPNFIGVSGPTVNQGEMKNVGWEFSLAHDNTIGQIHYEIKANLDTYQNTLVKFGADEINGVNIHKEGLPWNTYYVMIQDGVYQNQAEIDNENVVRQYAGGVTIKPGDIKYKDINGDGIIDNINDRAPVSGAFPKFNYSFNIYLSYKMFDLTCFFQGVQGKKLYVSAWGITPFNQASPPPVFWRDAWDGEGTSNFIPHIYMDGYGPMQAGNSSFYLRDASYLRMKSLQIGANLPNDWAKKILIQNARIYFSGDNLLTFTKFFSGQIDPERTGQGSSDASYPQSKIFTFGVKLTF